MTLYFSRKEKSKLRGMICDHHINYIPCIKKKTINVNTQFQSVNAFLGAEMNLAQVTKSKMMRGQRKY